MSDGAHQGVGASRALETILGGKEPPGQNEERTREQVLAQIMAAPTPDGPPPWEAGSGGDAYNAAALAIARAFWTVRQEGAPLEMDALWEATKKKWPGFNNWLGGATGFQVGWAYNCVRWLEEQPPAPNPAILEVDEP